MLPTGPIAGINISIAEVRAVVKGLTLTKKKTVCLNKKRGKCARRKVKKTKGFWFTQPIGPLSGKVSFEAFYGYDEPTPDIIKTVELSCPNFRA